MKTESAEIFKVRLSCYKIPINKKPGFGIPHLQIEPRFLRGRIVNVMFLVPQNDPGIIYSADCNADSMMIDGVGEYSIHSGWCKEHKRMWLRIPIRKNTAIIETYSTLMISEE